MSDTTARTNSSSYCEVAAVVGEELPTTGLF
jgi:hypothetical protein